jgi:hypothetical protein
MSQRFQNQGVHQSKPLKYFDFYFTTPSHLSLLLAKEKLQETWENISHSHFIRLIWGQIAAESPISFGCKICYLCLCFEIGQQN